MQEQLHLEISVEKSKITNLRKRKSEFLGFEYKANKKGEKWVAHSNIMKIKQHKIVTNGRELIKKTQKNPTSMNVNRLNSWILGLHNYYIIATHVNIDFNKIAYCLNRTMYNSFKSIGKHNIPNKPNATYKSFYKNNYRTWEILGIHIYPLGDIKTRIPMSFTQNVCNYTTKGREKIFAKLEPRIANQIINLMNTHIPNRSIEYFDNRISKYSMQQGKCHVTGNFLFANEVHCHHIKPVKTGGDDNFKNLVIVHKDIHKLIHATSDIVIKVNSSGLKTKMIDKVNKLRAILMLEPIKKLAPNKGQERSVHC